MGWWEALGAKVGWGRGARRGGKARSKNVYEAFNKTMVEGKNVLASNWRSKHFMTT